MQTTAAETSVAVSPRRKRPVWRWIRRGLLGLVVLLLLAAGLSALSNLFLPAGPQRTDRLDPLDKTRLAEALHLQRTLGDTAWPGFGTANIPVILWNRDYSFLVGISAPPAGWTAVPEDTFAGQPYYRRSSHDPQNFAVPVGDRWAASFATKYETDLFLREHFQQMLPPVIAQIMPYRLLIQDSEVNICTILHEGFHAYQETLVPEHTQAADAVNKDGTQYAQVDATMGAEWQNEIALLTKAAQAPTVRETADWARQFLAARDARRAKHALSPSLLAYERELEWLEGMAKYVELTIWRQGHTANGYTPLPETATDPDFKQYGSFESRWSQELDTMNRQATAEADVRLYYTGMAQGVALDRLGVDWKRQVLMEGAYVEDLLRAAVNTDAGLAGPP